MKTQIKISAVAFVVIALLFSGGQILGQSSLLNINGGGAVPAYIVMDNPATPDDHTSSPIYLVVNWDDTRAITRQGANAGWIISEEDGNFVKWFSGAGTGSFIFPFGVYPNPGYDEASQYIEFTLTKNDVANVTASTRGGGHCG